jgi:hypothetical protein
MDRQRLRTRMDVDAVMVMMRGLILGWHTGLLDLPISDLYD